MKKLIYYIPILGFVLFVYKSEKFNYKNRSILNKAPIEYIGCDALSELTFVLLHGGVFAMSLIWVVFKLLMT